MGETNLRILAVIGSLHRDSVTRIVLAEISKKLEAAGCVADVLDFEREPLPLYNPDTAYDAPAFPSLKKRVDKRKGHCRFSYGNHWPDFKEKTKLPEVYLNNNKLMKLIWFFDHIIKIGRLI